MDDDHDIWGTEGNLDPDFEINLPPRGLPVRELDLAWSFMCFSLSNSKSHLIFSSN